MTTETTTDPKHAPHFIDEQEATARLVGPGMKTPPIPVFATKPLRDGFDATCLEQALNARSAPGVDQLILNPDAHAGYGAPVGCVLVSNSHIYPGPVGVDIKCSMSLLQLDLPADAVADKRTRRALIEAICERTPTGAGKGQRTAKKSRRIERDAGVRAVINGATPEVCAEFGVPPEWASRCEDAFHWAHDGTASSLAERLDRIIEMGWMPNLTEKIHQFGSYGGGNHFGECNVVHVRDDDASRRTSDVFGLRDGHLAFLSHCGSRGFGNILATKQFKTMQEHFVKWSIPLPGGDREMVYAPLGSPEADNYLNDMALGANFATMNHMLINSLVLEAFQEVIPGTKGQLVYFISHNIARHEVVGKRKAWVHRKGATRACPAGHHSLADTPFFDTGHPILLPGNPQAGSAIMVAAEGAAASCYSVNHGAGRCMGRKNAMRTLDQRAIDDSFAEMDIMSNCRQYPRDEAPAAYKDFREVIRSVELAGLARTVADLRARFVIKDEDQSLKGAA